jgi:prolyl 4-hydroxylase
VGHYAMGGERQEKITRVMYLPPMPPQPDDCKNRHELCDHWAEAGECESNPSFMIGTKGSPGSCIRACYRCDLMPGAAGAGNSNA